MSGKKTVCFVTFGGSPNETDSKYIYIEKARDRIISQAKKSYQFDECIGLDWKQLSQLCSRFKIEIPQIPNRYIFTPILLKLISLSAFGRYDYFLYAGSGCEINTNYFARKDLNRMIKTAGRNLFYVEHTLLPEKSYTKIEAFRDFHVPERAQNSPQISATFFLVSCNTKPMKLLEISNEWLDYSTRKNGFYISNEFNPELQISGFKAHRNDQSLFSIVLKKNGVKSQIEKQRNFEKLFPAFRGSTVFIWTNRNRSGVSTIPESSNRFLLGLAAFLVTPIVNIRHQIITCKRLLKNFN